MAKETMKEKLARLEAELEREKWLNNELFEKLRITEHKLSEKNISEIKTNPIYVQMQQEIERYKLLYEEYKSLYEKSESRRQKEHGNCSKLYDELEKLANENTELKKPKEKIHNERGAGRKPSMTDEIKQNIINDREIGMTYKQLSAKHGYSVGIIHKLISEYQKKLVESMGTYPTVKGQGEADTP